MRMVKPVANKVNASCGNREHLIVLFYCEVQLCFHIVGDFRKKGMEVGFIRMKDYQVIGVTEIKTDLFLLFQPVIKIG